MSQSRPQQESRLTGNKISSYVIKTVIFTTFSRMTATGFYPDLS